MLKIGSPGVPDFYQGSELWDLSLVDPDNRRPVDFELRRRFLDSLDVLLALGQTERAAAVAETDDALGGRPDQDARHDGRPASQA